MDKEQPRDVLKDQPFGAKLADDTNDFPEETASSAFEALALAPRSRDRKVLARETGRDALNPFKVARTAVADVLEPPCFRKSIGKDSPENRIDLNLPRCFPASFPKTEVKAPDAGE